MKNTLLFCAGVTIVTLVFLLYQANIAVDMADLEKFTLIEIAVEDSCHNYSEKSIIECKMDAYYYVQELKNKGW